MKTLADMIVKLRWVIIPVFIFVTAFFANSNS